LREPQELDIDAHYAQIVELVEKHDIQRMVIDGMTSYSTAIGDMGIYRDFFHALVAYSKRRLMTTFFNYENPEFLGISSYMPDFPVSSVVDNLILMSLVEIDSSIHRCISVGQEPRKQPFISDPRIRDRRRRNQAHTPGPRCGRWTALAGLLESLK